MHEKNIFRRAGEGDCEYKIASIVIDPENRKILRNGAGDSKAKKIFGIMG